MLAGRNAFSEAFKNAGPKILEPIYDVEVFCPSDKMGDVMSDLQGRRGMIMGMSSESGYEKLVAKVPLKEMSSLFHFFKFFDRRSRFIYYEVCQL